MILFWILWVIDAIVALIALYFFVIGLSDGSVSSFNIGTWFGTLLLLTSLPGVSLVLKSKDRLLIAKIILALLAVPALLFAIFMLVTVFSGARWN